MMKICSNCNIAKIINSENFRNRIYPNGKPFFVKQCRDCECKKALNYRDNNLERIKTVQTKWRQNNPNYKKQYNVNNKEKIRKYRREYEARPSVKIKKIITNRIRQTINKNKNSVLPFLSYRIQELKEHLEKQFEPWMTWNNHGNYNPSIWKDDDVNTWTWQIDHIIPHSCFKYNKMSDMEFQKAWSLHNLRPLASKQNIIDGSKRTRHK